nr:hypothetical protein [Tanacetum cinerariifolium]
MSTQQDIYAAGSESRPHMLNKENYVPLSSCLLRYAKSRPNGKLIHNSIINSPYVRKMIPEPGDAYREINTILLGLPEDIYAAVDSCETAQEIWLRVQQMMKGSDIGIQEKKAKLFNEWERFTSSEGESIESYYHRFLKLMNDLKRNKHFPEKIVSNLKISSNPRNRQIAQPGMNMGQDRQIQMVEGNGGNQFRQYAGQNTGNLYGYNAVQNVKNQVAQNLIVQNVGNQNGLIGVQGNGNQDQIGNGNLVAVRTEGNAAGQNPNQIRCYNCMGQASTSGTQTDSAPVYNTDESTEVHKNYDDNEIFNMFTQEEQYTELLEPNPESHQVPQNDNNVISEDTSVEQGRETVEQHPTNFEDI